MGFILAFSFNGHCQEDGTAVIKSEVWNTVRTINRHWTTTKDMDSLSLFIHPEMILIFPGSKELQGKFKIIEMYQGYTSMVETISFEESNPII